MMKPGGDERFCGFLQSTGHQIVSCMKIKPHIGTDILTRVVENLRTSICKMGGEVRFHAKVVDIQTKETSGRTALTSLTVEDTRTGKQEPLKTELG